MGLEAPVKTFVCHICETLCLEADYKAVPLAYFSDAKPNLQLYISYIVCLCVCRKFGTNYLIYILH
jgi:hypothetical protein